MNVFAAICYGWAAIGCNAHTAQALKQTMPLKAGCALSMHHGTTSPRGADKDMAPTNPI